MLLKPFNEWKTEALKDEAKLEINVTKLHEEEVKQIDDKWNNCVKADKVNDPSGPSQKKAINVFERLHCRVVVGGILKLNFS